MISGGARAARGRGGSVRARGTGARDAGLRAPVDDRRPRRRGRRRSRRGRVVLARRPGGAPPPRAASAAREADARRVERAPRRVELFPEETIQHAARDYRRWAYESALLDLALGQAGMTLGEAVGRSYSPVRFVVSSNADPGRWLELYPGVELKVDAGAEWGRADFERLAALRIVRVVDIKGQYGSDYPQGDRDEAGLVAMAAEILPDAIIEDPSTEPDVLPVIAAAADRISFDAPVHSVADLAALPPIRHLNVKPSRFGTLERLCACLDHCRREGIAMYAGGQFELRRRPGPDPGAREPVLPGRPERLRAGRLQRARADRRPAGQPARRVGVARHDRVLSRRRRGRRPLHHGFIRKALALHRAHRRGRGADPAATGRFSPSTGSRSRSRRAVSWACSGRTAPARRRRSGC